MLQCNGGRNGDVEAFCKTVHGNVHVVIGQFECIGRKPQFFCSEHYCKRLVYWKLVQRDTIRMRTGGYDLVAFLLQLLNAVRGVVVVLSILV